MPNRLLKTTHQSDELHSLMVLPSTTPRPAVMVCHAWGGRSDFEVAQAERLAGLGYVGVAVDLYGEARQGYNREENQALMQPLAGDRVHLQARLQTLLEAIKDQPEVDAQRVVVMGYCFGGLCALDLARTGASIAGAVSIHGILKAPPTDRKPIVAKVLVLNGHDDPMVPNDDILALQQELTLADADWQLVNFGHTMHAFTHPDANDPDFGTVYSASADRRSHQMLDCFLTECFGEQRGA